MSEFLLTLGSFSFQGFDSPSSILVKSKQRLAIHHLGSGFSTVDCLGEDNEVASFHGTFTGANAAARNPVNRVSQSPGATCRSDLGDEEPVRDHSGPRT